MIIENTEKLPIKLWLDDIEDGALKQARNIANLPFAFKHIAIMPDSHQGYGMPIGAVMATKDVIIPNAVGVDIGCGMCAVKTSIKELDTDTLKKIMGVIREFVPVGFNKHKTPQDWQLMPNGMIGEIVETEMQNALKSLGTLGGGNHFIEIQKGDDGHIWIMIHSGSRNLGLKVANHYNNLAKKLNNNWFSSVNPKHDLAFLPINSEEGKEYIKEMKYCVDYALANRKVMMRRVKHAFKQQFEKIHFEEIINIAHNYAKMENHFNENVMIHRKGATLAQDGTIGIIPGSQGTKSYIVKGKGNADSFNSCSHGAGRLMSRKKAKETLSLEGEKKILDDLGVVHGIRGTNDLDEAPSSYKDISVVINNQKDLVDVVVELTPLGVIKG